MSRTARLSKCAMPTQVACVAGFTARSYRKQLSRSRSLLLPRAGRSQASLLRLPSAYPSQARAVQFPDVFRDAKSGRWYSGEEQWQAERLLRLGDQQAAKQRDFGCQRKLSCRCAVRTWCGMLLPSGLARVVTCLRQRYHVHHMIELSCDISKSKNISMLCEMLYNIFDATLS